MAVRLLGCLVPPGSIFPAPADVGVDPHAAVLQPRDPASARVDWGERNLEATVAIEPQTQAPKLSQSVSVAETGYVLFDFFPM